eukprot:CAMPEP_0113872898 /NCGR_PEP_ID=MMETSP0780_2-20120614/3472_1 /TAXON_ID=652834 /ORGANISM="Palpitomonas bilix" /LENGTH=419 /DNA_ID=CAMNT_0000858487 /DNA_START=98 /DNA_END=1353 /DNA_ORIENTATION=- /assembly_acc=CAM_ASM_000599
MTKEEEHALQKLASSAASRFYKGELQEAAEALQKIKEKKGEEPKLVHNVALLDFVKSGFRRGDRFLQTLTKVKADLQERVRKASVDSVDGDSKEIEFAVEHDVAIAMYNEALLFYQKRLYGKAIENLEPHFQSLEALEESVATKLSFLLYECYMNTKDDQKANEVIQKLAKTYALQLSERAEEGDQNGDGQEMEGGFPQADWTAVKTMLMYAKARVHLWMSQLKSSKKDVKAVVALTSSNSSSVFLKAHLEYSKGNFRKAMKLLSSCQQPTSVESPLPSLFYNNMGCIHFRLKKHNAAAFYFSRALKHNDESLRAASSQMMDGSGKRKEKFSLGPKKSDANGVNVLPRQNNKKCEMSYNIGLQLLLSGKPELAFDCFREASNLMYSDPRVWIRTAECCIAAQAMHVAERGERLQPVAKT